MSIGGDILVTTESGLQLAGALWKEGTNKAEDLRCDEAGSLLPVSISGDGSFILGSPSGRSAVHYLWFRARNEWEQLDCPPQSSVMAVNNRGDVGGAVVVDGFYRPWLKPIGSAIVMLPTAEFHDPCRLPSTTSDRSSAQP